MNLTVDAVRPSFYRNDMTADSREIEKQAQNLPAKERARLALALIESLDQGEEIDAEELWLDEAERRLEDYRAGRVEAIPANEVFEKIAKNRLFLRRLPNSISSALVCGSFAYLSRASLCTIGHLNQRALLRHSFQTTSYR